MSVMKGRINWPVAPTYILVTIAGIAVLAPGLGSALDLSSSLNHKNYTPLYSSDYEDLSGNRKYILEPKDPNDINTSDLVEKDDYFDTENQDYKLNQNTSNIPLLHKPVKESVNLPTPTKLPHSHKLPNDLIKNGVLTASFEADLVIKKQTTIVSFLQFHFNPLKNKKFKNIGINYTGKVLTFLNEKQESLAKFTIHKAIPKIIQALILLTHLKGSKCTADWVHKQGNTGMLHIGCDIDYNSSAYNDSTSIQFKCHKPKLKGLKGEAFAIDPPLFKEHYPTLEAVLSHMKLTLGLSPNHPISIISVDGRKVNEKDTYQALLDSVSHGNNKIQVLLKCAIQVAIRLFHPFIQAPDNIPTYPLYLYPDEYKKALYDPKYQSALVTKSITGSDSPKDKSETTFYLSDVDKHICTLKKGKLSVLPNQPKLIYETFTFLPHVVVTVFLMEQKKFTTTLSPLITVKAAVNQLINRVNEYKKDIKEMKKNTISFYGFELGNCQLHDISPNIYEQANKLPLYKIPTLLPCSTTKSNAINFYFGPDKPSEIQLEIYIQDTIKKHGPYKFYSPYDNYMSLGDLKTLIMRNLSMQNIFLTEKLEFLDIGGKTTKNSDSTLLSNIKEFIRDYRRNMPTVITITPHTDVKATYVDADKTKKFSFHVNSPNPTTEDLLKAYEEAGHKKRYFDGHLHHDLNMFDRKDKSHNIDFVNHHLPPGTDLSNVIFQGDNNKNLKINYTNGDGKTNEFTIFVPYKMDPNKVQSHIKAELIKRGLIDPISPDIIVDDQNFWDIQNPTVHVYKSNTMPVHGFYNGHPVDTTINFKTHTPFADIENLAKTKVANLLGDKTGMKDFDFSILSNDGEHTYKDNDDIHNYTLSFGSPIKLDFGPKQYCFINHNGEKRCSGIAPDMLRRFTIDTLSDHLRDNGKLAGDKIPENVKLSEIILKDGRRIPCEYLFGSETLDNVCNYYGFDMGDVLEFKFDKMNNGEIDALNAFQSSGELIRARISKMSGEKETITTLLDNMDLNSFKVELLNRFSTLTHHDQIINIKVNGKTWKTGMLFSNANIKENREAAITFEVANDRGRKPKVYIQSMPVQPKDDDTIVTFFNRAFSSPLVYGLRPNESYRLNCFKNGKIIDTISTTKLFRELDCDSFSIDPLGMAQDGLPHVILKAHEKPDSQHTISGNIDTINMDLRNYFSDLLDSGSNLEAVELDIMGIPFKCTDKIWYSHHLLSSLTLDTLIAHCTGEFKNLESKLQNNPLTEIKIKPTLGNYSQSTNEDSYPLVMGLSLNRVPTQIYTTINVTKLTIKNKPTEFANLIHQTFGKSLSNINNINVNLWISNTLHHCTKIDTIKGLLNMNVKEILRHCNASWQLLELIGGAKINVDVIETFKPANDGSGPNRILLNMSSTDDSKTSSIPNFQSLRGELKDFVNKNGGHDVFIHPDRYSMNVSIDHHEPQQIPLSELWPQYPYNPAYMRKHNLPMHNMGHQTHLGPNAINGLGTATFFNSANNIPHQTMDITLERLPDGIDPGTYFNMNPYIKDNNMKGGNNGPHGLNGHKGHNAHIGHVQQGPTAPPFENGDFGYLGSSHLWDNMFNPASDHKTKDPLSHGGWSVEAEFSAEQLLSDYANISHSISNHLKSKLGNRLDLVSNARVIVNVNGHSHRCNLSNLSQFEKMDTKRFLEKCLPIDQLSGNPNVSIRVEYDPYTNQFVPSNKIPTSSSATLIIPTFDGKSDKVLGVNNLDNKLPPDALSELKKHKDGFLVSINGTVGDCFIPTEAISNNLTVEDIIDHCGVDNSITQFFNIHLIPNTRTGKPYVNITMRERDGESFSDVPYIPGDKIAHKGKLNFDTTTINDIIRDAASHDPVNVKIYRNNTKYTPDEFPERLGNVPLSSLPGSYNISFEYDPTGSTPGFVSMETLEDSKDLASRLSRGDFSPGCRLYLTNEHSHVPVERVPEHLLHMPGKELNRLGYVLEIVHPHSPTALKKIGAHKKSKRPETPNLPRHDTTITIFSNLLNDVKPINSLQTPIQEILGVDDKTAKNAQAIKLVVDGMITDCEIPIGDTDWIHETLESLLQQCNIRDLDHDHNLGIFIIDSKNKDIDISLNGSGVPKGGKQQHYKLNLTSSLDDLFNDSGIKNLNNNASSHVLFGVNSGNKEQLIDVDKESFSALLNQHPTVLDALLKFGVPEDKLTSTHSLRIIMESLSKALEILNKNGVKLDIELGGVEIEKTHLQLNTKLSEIFDKIESLNKLLSDHHNLLLHVQMAFGQLVEFTITTHDLTHAIHGGLTLRDLLLHGLDADSVDKVSSVFLAPNENENDNGPKKPEIKIKHKKDHSKDKSKEHHDEHNKDQHKENEEETST